MNIPRYSLYYSPVGISESDHLCMRYIDETYTRHPFFGYRRMNEFLRREHGIHINDKRIRRLMHMMGIRCIYPKKRTTISDLKHKKYPYLLADHKISVVNDAWATDITYIRMHIGFMYLVTIIDLHSRYIISWKLSNSMDIDFCIDALEDALATGCPKIFNSDQGVQFTSTEFTDKLHKHDVKISMTGKGRCIDNIIMERFWRSLKYEEVYIKDYQNVQDACKHISEYIDFYNIKRPHQSLSYNTPIEIYNNHLGFYPKPRSI